jgi:NAD(P)-dependent dehydrogenase (short-subunit alcohol dehydrogenase family)
VQTALESFGELHVLVNNAGILRDKMFVNMDVQMWDDVMRVHLRGTFCPTRHAVDHWRARHRAGDPVSDARIVNTSSPSGLYGNVGQTNYGAAKAAIAGLTVILADELARLGVTVNAIAPSALTQMTAGLDAYVEKLAEIRERTGFDAGSPANIAPLVVWLASPEAAHVTGRVFNVKGGRISVAETWVAGPYVEKEARWETTELGAVIPELLAAARPNSDGSGTPRSTP